MHKLDRTCVERPGCLDPYDHRTQTWDDANPCKPPIRAALDTMQAGRCAYCEGPLFDGAHIEHFRRKNAAHFPELTFEWTNLFLACESREHCGHYKDRPGAPIYNADDLIKPDIDDPDTFLYFHKSGEVRPRGGIDAQRAWRATETIRVFGLDEPALSADRRGAVRRYLRSGQGNVDAILAFEPGERFEFLREELDAVADHPHATVIKHLLERL